MTETITVFYTPLLYTKLAAAIGLSVASHMAIVYTNSAGQSFGVSSGPSHHAMLSNPLDVFTPISAMARGTPSLFGTLMADPNNNHPFIRRHPDDYFTQDDLGMPYPSHVVARGADLSAPWHKIVATYANEGRLHLTYSPISQNSNSMAGFALQQAGLKIPFDSTIPFTPGVFTRLPLPGSSEPLASNNALPGHHGAIAP